MAFNPKEHLMNLKGKDYLQVMWRLVWFREDHKDWNIDTQLVEHSDNAAIFVCKIYDADGIQKASGYGSETIKDFRDYLEKAETKSIGRALAMLGYGTQFAPELDECDRIVDSPVDKKKAPAPKAEPKKAEYICTSCGKTIVPMKAKNGKPVPIEKHIDRCLERWGAPLCCSCISDRLNEADAK